MKIFRFLKLTTLLLYVTVLLSGCAGNTTLKSPTKPEISAQPNPVITRVIMLDIEQGDSLLIQSNGKNILVDSSKIDTRKILLDKLKKYQVNELDLVITTHSHEDHIGGMDAVLDNIKIKQIYDPAVPSTSKLYQNYLRKIQAKKIPFAVPKSGSRYKIADNTYLEFFTPLDKQIDNNPNNSSLVFKLIDNKFTMLFTGDIEKIVEKELVQKYNNQLKSDVLKSPHHGSRTSSSHVFLNAVQAKDVLISCGKNNEYGHPHEPIVERYKAKKMNMYTSHQTGDIAIVAADSGYKIITEK